MTKFSAPQQSQLAQIGAFLRENREKQEKSLEDIAIRTYIRPQLLNGIEKGDPDLLPEPIFVQGFIRRYAEALGLKGTDLAQQFTVTSIPSTPRPARQSAPADSPSTRISRAAPDQTPSHQNSATTPMLSKASTPLPNDPFLNGGNGSGVQSNGGQKNGGQKNGGQNNGGQNRPVSSPPLAATPTPEVASTEAVARGDRPSPITPPEIPLIPETTAEPVAAPVPEAPPAEQEELPAVSPTVTKGHQSELSSEASLAARPLETERSGNGNLLERIDGQPGDYQPSEQPVNGTPPAALKAPTEHHSAPSVMAEPFAASGVETANTVETVETFEEAPSNGTQGYQAEPNNADFDTDLGTDSDADSGTDLPMTPTTGLRTEAAPVLPVGPPATNTGPVGVEPSDTGYERSSTPNLKPFIIGGVVAALTAGVVILASLLGNGDRQPKVTGSVDPTSQPADSVPNAEPLEDPAETVKPPVSTAPVYVEATATDQAWVSVIADGSTIFEGTLQPGDTQLWEAQETLDIFAGNAGGLELAPNGGAATVMGSNGQQGEKVFTPE